MLLTTAQRSKPLLLVLLILSSLFYQAAYAEDKKIVTPVYIELTPDFIVNYAPKNKQLKYIKTKITLGTDSIKATVIKENLPLVKDALIMFLSSRTVEQVTGAVALEKTREAATLAINKALKKETNQEPLQDVLFSSFVTQ